MRWLILLLGLGLPAPMALLDCANRPVEHFEDGEAGKRGRLRRLFVGVAGAWMLWGNGIVLGYYYGVVKRNTPVGV